MTGALDHPSWGNSSAMRGGGIDGRPRRSPWSPSGRRHDGVCALRCSRHSSVMRTASFSPTAESIPSRQGREVR